jgi:hypothetical protein
MIEKKRSISGVSLSQRTLTWKISDVAKTPWAPELDNSIIAANFGNVAE